MTFCLSWQDLVDIDVFLEAKKVIEALQKKEVGPALAWCADNKSRLKKSKVNYVLPIFSTFILSRRIQCVSWKEYISFHIS